MRVRHEESQELSYGFSNQSHQINEMGETRIMRNAFFLPGKDHSTGGAPETPVVVIRARKRLFDLDLKALWEYRELLYFFAWRDIKVRYKQTVLGIAWAFIQPLSMMVVFALIFGKFAQIPSGGFPYEIFSFTALLPWNLFAGALTRGTTSIVSDSNLVSKVYFPRLLLPISAVVSGIVDFAISFVILIGMMAWFRIVPTWGILALPGFILLALLTALAVSLWLGSLNVKYRDVGHIIPFVVQFWMFASPVAYPVDIVPEEWRWLYSLNPMAGVIEGFRWALLGKASPDFGVIAISISVVFIIFYFGIVYFRKTE